MTIRAHKEKIFAKGGGEYIRTVPTKGVDTPYIGYIKTTLGESRVQYNNPVVFEVLVNGEEITETEYRNANLTVINNGISECQHSWRDAYLKNSLGTKHIIFCTLCNKTRSDNENK